MTTRYNYLLSIGICATGQFISESPVKGEIILLCKRNQPIAEIRPLQSRRTQKRPIGLAKGRFAVSKEFFEPLPEELVQAFHGETQ